MKWAQLKDLDVLALPWGQVLAWPRRWQCALLALGWAFALLLFAYAWYWPQQDRLSAQAQQRAQRTIQHNSMQADMRTRRALAQQLAALQSRLQVNPATHADWLLPLEQLSATGVVVQQWRSQGQAQHHVVFQGEWPAVYHALSGLSRSVLWGQLKLQRVNGEMLQASVDVQRHANAPALTVTSHNAVALTHFSSPFAELANTLQPNQQRGAGGVATSLQVPPIRAPSLSRAGPHGRYQAQREQALAQPLATMQLLGVVQASMGAVALVLAGGHTWRIELGQRLGSEGLRVQRITADAVQLGQGRTLVVATKH
jgi:hypothetical protein